MSGTLSLSQADFPGYAEAVARENLVRAAACLGVKETVCGLEVLPLTSRHVRLLAFVNSPFLIRGATVDILCQKPGIDTDILLLLWAVSPGFRAGNVRARNRFYKRNRHVMKLRVNVAVKEILEYIEEAYLDASEPGDEQRSYYAFEISIVTALHKSYGLPIDFWETGWLRNFVRRITGKPSPLDVPLKIFWQLQKIERLYNDPKVSLSNPSCKVLSAGLVAINARSQKLHEYMRELRTSKSTMPFNPSSCDGNGAEYGAN